MKNRGWIYLKRMRIAVAFARWNVFIVLKIKNNINFQCASARIISGVRLERRVATSLVSRRHPQRLAMGFIPQPALPHCCTNISDV